MGKGGGGGLAFASFRFPSPPTISPRFVPVLRDPPVSHFPSFFSCRGFFLARKREHNLGEPFSTRGGVFIFLLGWRTLALLSPRPFWGVFVSSMLRLVRTTARELMHSPAAVEKQARSTQFASPLFSAGPSLSYLLRSLAINFPCGGKSIKRQSDAGQRKIESGQRRSLENFYLFAGVLAVPQISRRNGKRKLVAPYAHGRQSFEVAFTQRSHSPSPLLNAFPI